MPTVLGGLAGLLTKKLTVKVETIRGDQVVED
jgi:hypothetical protein